MRTVAMRRDETLRLRTGRQGLVVRSDRGTHLVTQESDPNDHVLEVGEEFRAARRGRVVVWTLRDGVLAVRTGEAGFEGQCAIRREPRLGAFLQWLARRWATERAQRRSRRTARAPQR